MRGKRAWMSSATVFVPQGIMTKYHRRVKQQERVVPEFWSLEVRVQGADRSVPSDGGGEPLAQASLLGL